MRVFLLDCLDVLGVFHTADSRSPVRLTTTALQNYLKSRLKKPMKAMMLASVLAGAVLLAGSICAFAQASTQRAERPMISSITPLEARPGQKIILRGNNLDGVLSVSIYSVGASVSTFATSFSIDSTTQITATIPVPPVELVLNKDLRIAVQKRIRSTANNGRDETVTVTFEQPFTYSLAESSSSDPIITSIEPIRARPGDRLVITGNNLLGVDAVAFGVDSTLVLSNFAVTSTNRIECIVPAQTPEVANFSVVRVFAIKSNIDRLAISSQAFTFLEAQPSSGTPIITGLSPAQAFPGEKITISGINLDGVNSVNFGFGDTLVAPTAFEVFPTRIETTVPVPTQNVALVAAPRVYVSKQNSPTVASLQSFTFLSGRSTPESPVISTISTLVAAAEERIIIRGNNLNGVHAVSFQSRDFTVIVNALFTVDSPQQITVTVPKPSDELKALPQVFIALSKRSSVGERLVTVFSRSFKFFVTPTITSIRPAQARPGDRIFIRGTDLDSISVLSLGVVGADVRFRSFTLNTPTLISAVVPTPTPQVLSLPAEQVLLNATKRIRIDTNTRSVSITAVGLPFKFAAPVAQSNAPVIESLSAFLAEPEERLVIKGTNLENTKEVTFQGLDFGANVTAGTFTVNSSQQITVTVPHPTTAVQLLPELYVSITKPTASGDDVTAFSRQQFRFFVRPVINGISPRQASAGEYIVIRGSGFDNVTTVLFGSFGTEIESPSFTIDSPSQITAVVPVPTKDILALPKNQLLVSLRKGMKVETEQRSLVVEGVGLPFAFIVPSQTTSQPTSVFMPTPDFLQSTAKPSTTVQTASLLTTSLLNTVAKATAKAQGIAPQRLQAYPNPASTLLTVEYAVAAAGRVRVDVVNALGERVLTAFEGEQSSGLHSLTIDARGLAGGTYFCRVSAASGVQVVPVRVER